MSKQTEKDAFSGSSVIGEDCSTFYQLKNCYKLKPSCGKKGNNV
jgi:hypothetical protein